MNVDRGTIARRAGEQLGRASAVQRPRVLIGFDGFLDDVTHLVEVRRDMSPSGYERMRTITAFAQRCARAAGKSTNIEQVLIERRFGGNGPLMASGLSALGAETTYIGAIGDPQEESRIHEVFREFAARCRKVTPLGVPSSTLCLEFDDGKIMLNETSRAQEVTWERLVARVGIERLRAECEEARLIGIVNWSLLGGVGGIWEGLMREVLPTLSPARRHVFIDLSDPAKRTDDDLRGALETLGRMNASSGVDVTLGLNLAEAGRVARVCGVEEGGSGSGDMREAGRLEGLAERARELRERIGISCVVIHPREGAAGATGSGAAWFLGPFTREPRLSTGAGDHFNAGFAHARLQGLGLTESLACGCACSGVYVRDAKSPDRDRLAQFLEDLPEAE